MKARDDGVCYLSKEQAADPERVHLINDGFHRNVKWKVLVEPPEEEKTLLLDELQVDGVK